MNQKLKDKIEKITSDDRYGYYSPSKIDNKRMCFAVSHRDYLYILGVCKEYILDGTQEFLKDVSSAINSTPITIVTKPENLVKIKNVLHQVESYIGFKLTTFETYKEVFTLCTGDKRWSIAPPVLSLYASLMRLAIYVESNDNIVEQILNKKIYSDFRTDNSIYNHPLIATFLNNLNSIEDYFTNDLKINYAVGSETPRNIHCLGILEYLNWLQTQINRGYNKDFVKMTKKLLTNV